MHVGLIESSDGWHDQHVGSDMRRITEVTNVFDNARASLARLKHAVEKVKHRQLCPHLAPALGI